MKSTHRQLTAHLIWKKVASGEFVKYTNDSGIENRFWIHRATIQKFGRKFVMATPLSLEKDIYPAFSSGELDKICTALSTLVAAVSRSTHDADSIFRSFNWSWPMLTAKARSSSPQGILVIEGFTSLLTSLLLNCSSPLIATVAGSRNVIRIIMRDLGLMKSSLVRNFLNAVQQTILGAKDVRAVRGYILEKSAVEHLILLSSSSDDDELAEIADSMVEKILVHRKLFTIDFIVDFVVKLVKSKGNGNADSALIVRNILESHRSSLLYDSLMEKLTFLSPGDSVLKRLRVVHFLYILASSDTPGTSTALTKAELTSCILSSNKLVSLLTLKLFGSILARLEHKDSFDKIVEISALLPLVQSLASGPASPSNVLILSELSKVFLVYKRVCRGVFSECKFNWLKLIVPSAEKPIVMLILKLLFGIYATSTPLTHHVGILLVRAMELGEERAEISEFSNELVDKFFESNFSINTSSITKKKKLIVETFCDMLINNPKSLGNDPTNILSPVLEKLGIEKYLKKIRKIETVEISLPVAKRQKVQETKSVLPRVSYKKRYLCPPFPDMDVDPLDPDLAGWATIALANEFGEEEEVVVNLIDLVGKRINTFHACIMSLSHSAPVVRQCAFDVLAVILRAVALSIEKGQEEGRYAFREAPQVAMVLTWFRNGIDQTETALPRIVTCFIVEVLKLMFQPQHLLYPILFKLILRKPFVRTNDFLYWINFFFPTDASGYLEPRMWVLRIMDSSATDPDSVDIMIRRGIVQSVMESAVNLNTNSEEFEIALQILAKVARHNTVEVARKFGLPHWLRSVAISRHIR